jgi:hypothetical protein
MQCRPLTFTMGFEFCHASNSRTPDTRVIWSSGRAAVAAVTMALAVRGPVLLLTDRHTNVKRQGKRLPSHWPTAGREASKTNRCSRSASW